MSTLENATISRIESERTKVDLVACIASFVDALACLIFLLWQTKLTNVGRSYIECIVDPVTCLIGYWGFYRRLHDTEAILADIGFIFVVLGTLALTCQNAVEDLANLNSFWLGGDSPKEVDWSSTISRKLTTAAPWTAKCSRYAFSCTKPRS